MTKPLVSLLLATLMVGLLMPNPPASAEETDLVTDEEIQALIPEVPADEDADVVHLGKKFSWRNLSFVDGYAFIHYKEQAAHRESRARRRTTRDCYGFLAKGAKWKANEAWEMNPANAEGLDPNTLFANMTANIAKWEDAADGTADDGWGIDIMGNGTLTSETLSPDTTSPDNRNEIIFGEISKPGAIAVTIVWGSFGGAMSRRQLIEWDMVFDQHDYDWSLTADAIKMDFENIATHELGHAFGLTDLYNSCIEETMFGYATNGETAKRTLNAGDILGISTLY